MELKPCTYARAFQIRVDIQVQCQELSIEGSLCVEEDRRRKEKERNYLDEGHQNTYRK